MQRTFLHTSRLLRGSLGNGLPARSRQVASRLQLNPSLLAKARGAVQQRQAWLLQQQQRGLATSSGQDKHAAQSAHGHDDHQHHAAQHGHGHDHHGHDHHDEDHHIVVSRPYEPFEAQPHFPENATDDEDLVMYDRSFLFSKEAPLIPIWKGFLMMAGVLSLMIVPALTYQYFVQDAYRFVAAKEYPFNHLQKEFGLDDDEE